MELDRYLANNPRIGDVPLFPMPEDDSRPMRRDVAAKWPLRAEKLAELPKLVGGSSTHTAVFGQPSESTSPTRTLHELLV